MRPILNIVQLWLNQYKFCYIHLKTITLGRNHQVKEEKLEQVNSVWIVQNMFTVKNAILKSCMKNTTIYKVIFTWKIFLFFREKVLDSKIRNKFFFRSKKLQNKKYLNINIFCILFCIKLSAKIVELFRMFTF